MARPPQIKSFQASGRPPPDAVALQVKNELRRLEKLARNARACHRKTITRLEARAWLKGAGLSADARTVCRLYKWANEEGEYLRVLPGLSNVLNAEEKYDRAATDYGAPKITKALDRTLSVLADKRIFQQTMAAYTEALPDPGASEDATRARDAEGERRFREDLAGITRVREAVAAASRRVRGGGRKNAIPGLHEATALLACKYEELSGRPFAFHVVDEPAGRSFWERPGTNPACRFIATGLRDFFPELTDRNIRSALDKYSRIKDLGKT
jgi:hypothetical protein